MNGRAYIWWEDLKNVKKVSEMKITWNQLKKYLKKHISLRDIMMVTSNNLNESTI
jgi:hypothetical protein